MRISDWSSDVCSSDLSFSTAPLRLATYLGVLTALLAFVYAVWVVFKALLWGDEVAGYPSMMAVILLLGGVQLMALGMIGEYLGRLYERSEEPTSELQSLMRISYAVFCLKKKNNITNHKLKQPSTIST